MSVQVQHICDYLVRKKKCGEPADYRDIEVSLGGTKYRGDFCTEHVGNVEEALTTAGFEPVGTKAKASGKGRKAMRTASGKTFTVADARPWLMEQGLIENSHGRVGKDKLDIYAEAH